MLRARAVGVATAALLVLTAAGCDKQLAGSVGGPTTLFVELPDAQDLVRGHTVQIGNVVVGSVRDVSLIRSDTPTSDGRYAARVELQVVDGREIPTGTTVTLRRTSLLGEHFLDLALPERGGDVAPFYADGDTLAAADPECRGEPAAAGADPSCVVVLDDFEDVAFNAAEVFGAVVGRDLGTIVDSASEALAGRGPQLNALIADLSDVVTTIAAQRTDLAAAIDGLATLGATLAPGSDTVGTLIDDLAATSITLADQRGRIVTALGDLTDLAQTTNDVLLEPHAERLRQLLSDLDPVVATLAANRDRLDALVVDLLGFSGLIPQAIDARGQLNAWAWIMLDGAMGTASSAPLVPLDLAALATGEGGS